MTLLAVEILLAAFALKRGWRAAPLLLVTLPLAAEASQAAFASSLAWLGDYFDPAATARALAHAFALAALVIACWAGPGELPVPMRSRAPRRRSGPLYQI